MSASPARSHTRRGVRHALTSTGRLRSICDEGQPEPGCGCGACFAYFASVDRHVVPSSSLARE